MGQPAPALPDYGLTVAVIGAGSAGRSFALACALAGYRVNLEDVMPAKLRDAAAVFSSVGQAVVLVSTIEDAVRNADVAVDFMPDDLESKLEIFSMVDRMAPPRTILCTPSDVLSITDLASCTYRPSRCVMMRGESRLLCPRGVDAEVVQTITGMWRGMGMELAPEDDPDLPMLMKNMGFAAGEIGLR